MNRRRAFLGTLSAALAGSALRGQQAPPPTTLPWNRSTVATSLLLYATGPDGPWRSRDWGANWEPMHATGVQKAEDLGSVRDVVLVGPLCWLGGERGLFESEDFGLTWKAVKSAASPDVLALALSRYPQADPTTFAGTPRGLVVSEDFGRTWKPRGLDGLAVYRLEWPGPALVAGTSAGLRISMDGGATFAPAGLGLPATDVRAFALSSFFAIDPILYAAAGTEGVFRSEDGGRTWLRAGLAGRRVNDLFWFGKIVYAATDQGVFRSEEKSPFTPLGTGLEGVAGQRLLFPQYPTSGAEVFLASDRGIWHTADGGARWEIQGLKGRRVNGLYTFPAAKPVNSR